MLTPPVTVAALLSGKLLGKRVCHYGLLIAQPLVSCLVAAGLVSSGAAPPTLRDADLYVHSESSAPASARGYPCSPMGGYSFAWSVVVNNTRMPLGIETKSLTSTLYIPAGTLPAGSTVTLSLSVCYAGINDIEVRYVLK